MSTKPLDDQRVARSLGLKVPVYQHLREALAAGEHPEWLRVSDPDFAGLFPNPLGFELLCERLQGELSVERRRANLLRALEAKNEAEVPDLAGLKRQVEEANDEGELEDLALAIEPSAPPPDWQKPDREELAAFVGKLRSDTQLARLLRRLFREKAVVRAELQEGGENDLKSYRQYHELSQPLISLSPAQYLLLRRGEHAHALKLYFELPAAELRGVFDKRVSGYPPQERESYRKLFLSFVEQERLPRLVQDARARLKRAAESMALQQAWSHLDNALDRGRHEGPVLGFFSLRNHKVHFALVDRDGKLLRTALLSSKSEQWEEELRAFLGEERPGLLAVQADSLTRSLATRIQELLGGQGDKPRVALVPVAVIKTLLREVARRAGETHLSHDERQALLLARLAHDPRACAFHTPHVVRAYIQNRAEINHRRLEAFELDFLRNILLARGVDLNGASRDMLRLVPGIDAAAVEIERSTAPFRSLADFQARVALPAMDWRAACCFLRVRDGDQPLDARPLHPVYYPVVEEASRGSGLSAADLVRDPDKIVELAWQPILDRHGWSDRMVDYFRQCLHKAPRRQRRAGRVPDGQRLEALEVGATYKGVVTNLTSYGAFVDVGARREGLLPVSEIASGRYIKDPAEVLQAGQEVTVRVLSIDVQKQRFRLSMRPLEEAAAASAGGREGERGVARDTRPREARGARDRRSGGAPGGDRRGAAPERGERRPRRRDRDEVEVGPDPRAQKREEIDPTNPFYQFFKNQDVQGRFGAAQKGGPAGAKKDGKKGEKQQEGDRAAEGEAEQQA